MPAPVRSAIDALQRYFAGDTVDFCDIELDLSRDSPFHRSIYAVARTIPWGRTATYGSLARQVGEPGAARAIGQAMGRNPIPIIVPCHRVIASSGKLGGFSAHGGTATKERLLALEGIELAAMAPLLPLMRADRA